MKYTINNLHSFHTYAVQLQPTAVAITAQHHCVNNVQSIMPQILTNSWLTPNMLTSVTKFKQQHLMNNTHI